MPPVTHVDESTGRSAMAKAFWRILPLVLIAYLFAYMDRVNVSFAAKQMNHDLGFSATTYGLGGGLFFLSYALFAVPANLMLVRFGARRWIAWIMMAWGLLSSAMMFVHTPAEFYALRFLLGVAEAGFYPGVITYFAEWFPPCHRSRAVSRFFVASPLASVAMGAMAGWLLGLDGHGGLTGWQWLFLVQGAPTVLVGLTLLLLLPERPALARWLTAAEKQWITTELAREQARMAAPARQSIIGAFRNPRVLISGTIGFMLVGTIIAFSLSAPLYLMGATGLSETNVGYLVSLGGLIGVGAILTLGNLADRVGDRLLVSAWCAAIMTAAFAALLIVTTPVMVALTYLVFATVCFAIPMLTSSTWADMFSVGELAVASAAINTLSQIGAFLMPFGWGALKDLTGTFTAGVAALLAMSLATTMLTLILRRMLRGDVGRRAAVRA